MAEEPSRVMASESLLAAWIKWTMDFWQAMAEMGPGLAGVSQTGGKDAAMGAADGDSWLSALKLWQAFFSLMTEPGTVTAVFKGIKAPSEIILKMAQAGWEGYFHLHQQWLEGWQGDGPQAAALHYENLDQDIFKICNEIYESDFSQLLNLPHLRLTCLSQEDVNQAMDKFNQFQAAMAEFIYLIYLPVKKSLRAMGGGQGNGGADERPSEEFKEYYKRWLKLLEGHYMILFQSREYTGTLSHALNALEDFFTAKQKLTNDAMTALGLPTLRDLDEVYREMYLLKKSVKEMAKKIDRSGLSPGEG
ncbi:MAG: poly(R)-hydroxyalkanoic acid synthase subunit PhaE [Desulfobaccales bacterium]